MNDITEGTPQSKTSAPLTWKLGGSQPCSSWLLLKSVETFASIIISPLMTPLSSNNFQTFLCTHWGGGGSRGSGVEHIYIYILVQENFILRGLYISVNLWMQYWACPVSVIKAFLTFTDYIRVSDVLVWQFSCLLKCRLKVPWDGCLIGFTSRGHLIGSRQWSAGTPLSVDLLPTHPQPPQSPDGAQNEGGFQPVCGIEHVRSSGSPPHPLTLKWTPGGSSWESLVMSLSGCQKR